MTRSTRDRILDVAEDHFASRGFDAASVVQIAEAVGIRGPAVYKHFADKAALYDAVVQRLYAPLHGLLDDLADDAVRSEALAVELVRYHAEHPNLPRLLQHATLADDERLDALVEAWYRPLFARIGGGRETPGLAMALHSLLLGYINLAPLHRRVFDVDPFGSDEFAEQLQLLATLWEAASDE